MAESTTPVMTPQLKVVGGKQDGQSLPLPKGKFLIGREEDCHLRPNSDLVSRHHCVFTVDEYSVRLRDLGSTNGTLVNGEPLRGAMTLKEGDHVVVGKLELEVVLGGEADDAADPVEDVADVLEAAEEIAAADTSGDDTLPGAASGSETMVDMPAVAPDQFAQPIPQGDDTVHGGQMAQQPPQQPMFGYPQQMPYGMPQMPPGYGAPQGYPQYPGYPPQGYPQQGFPPPGYGQPMPQQGYPQHQPPPAAEPEPEPEPEPGESKKRTPEISLPDPTTTGAKAPEPKAPPKEGGGGQQGEKIPDVASGIIKQYFERRPKTE